MSVDLIATSLTLHGGVCTAAVLAIWKLGGESKFGTDKVADLHNLRPKLLKSTVTSLELVLTPVLVTNPANETIEAIEAIGIVMEDNPDPKLKPARLNVTGKEALTNVVRDFVKSDAQALVDLCAAHHLDERLTHSLGRLRKLVWVIFAFTGVVCIALAAAKFEWMDLKAGWLHVTAFTVVVVLLVGVGCLFWRILNASNSVDHLKSRYADL